MTQEALHVSQVGRLEPLPTSHFPLITLPLNALEGSLCTSATPSPPTRGGFSSIWQQLKYYLHREPFPHTPNLSQSPVLLSYTLLHHLSQGNLYSHVGVSVMLLCSLRISEKPKTHSPTGSTRFPQMTEVMYTGNNNSG